MYHVNTGFSFPSLTPAPAKTPAVKKPAPKDLVAKNPVAKQAAKPVAKPAPKALAQPTAKKNAEVKQHPAIKPCVPLPSGLEKALEKAVAVTAHDLVHIGDYAGNAYKSFNQKLAQKGTLPESHKNMYNSLVAASAKVKEPVTLHRGLKFPAEKMPEKWIEERFASSSLQLQTAKSFASYQSPDKATLLELNVQPDVRVVLTCQILNKKGSGYGLSEQEVTIAPGAEFRVVGREGYKLIVEVHPGEQRDRKYKYQPKKEQAKVA